MIDKDGPADKAPRPAGPNLDQILAVVGIDVSFVGPGDLSQSMGYSPSVPPGGRRAQPALDLVDDTLRRIRVAGKTAGTLVVKERRGVTLASLTSGAVAPFPVPAPGEALPQPTLANIGLLNDQDYNLVQEFLGRRSELGREARARLGVQLAGNIQVRLGLPQGGDAERFLQYVAGEYQLLKRQQQLSSEL
jgi:hypothetical protein